MAKAKITLFVDIVSPFNYLGFYALHNFPVFKQCDITYVPVFLGGIMKACGNTPPLKIKNKDKWIETERKRWTRAFNVPVSESSPPNFPTNTITCQRALTSLFLSHPDLLPQAIAAFYQNYWVSYTKPEAADGCLKVLTEVLGSEGEAKKVFEQTKSEEVKGLLSKNTDLAIEQGAFGLPWFVATNSQGETEGYWGFDHIGQMCDHLGLERPSNGGWKAML